MQFKKSFIFSTAVLIVVTAMAGIGYGFADDAMLGGAQGGIKKILQSSEPIGLTLDSGEKAPVNDIGFLNHPKMPAGTDNFTGLPSTVTIEDFGDPFEVLEIGRAHV